MPRSRCSSSSRAKTLAADVGVEIARRLVGEEETGPAGERARDRDPLLLASGKRARPVVPAVGETDAVEQLRGALPRLAGLPCPRSGAGNATFSSAVNSGSRWWNWKTNPIRSFRKRARSFGGERVERLPEDLDAPESGRSMPPSRWRSVDFPTPEGPMTAANTASSTSKERSRKTVTGAPSPT